MLVDELDKAESYLTELESFREKELNFVIDTAAKLDLLLKNLSFDELDDKAAMTLNTIYSRLESLTLGVGNEKSKIKNKLVKFKAGNKQTNIYKLNKGYE
jgi:hypothetical protein